MRWIWVLYHEYFISLEHKHTRFIRGAAHWNSLALLTSVPRHREMHV